MTMAFHRIIAAATILGMAVPAVAAEDVKAAIDKDYPSLESLYRELHSHPELSGHEVETAKRLAKEARAAGFEVTEHVGGNGLVAVLKNGPGPTLLLRTELDALPVQEKTGLPFASTVTTKNAAGDTIPVMHACGHDMHMSAWYGTAKVMAENRKSWSGTLMLIGQPAEEPLKGAAAMLKDGLFTRFPKPDYALSLHDDASMASGIIMVHPGAFRASADVVNITIFGQGGHGAVPHEARDPIVLSARVIMALQTLVSRENNPVDPVVITVGSIHGGTQANIIPDQVKLALTVRTFNPEVRKRVLASIAREVKGEALAANMPKEPLVDIQPGTDSVYNDPALMARVVPVLQDALGKDKVVEMPPKMTSEDFSQYGLAGAHALLLHVGAVAPERLAAAKKAGEHLPGTHSPQWAPDFKPTVHSMITAETAVLLDLFKGEKK